jgi:hypothetical protein
MSFPAGRHDDQVDALDLVGQLLDHMPAGQPRPTDMKSRRAIGEEERATARASPRANCSSHGRNRVEVKV